ncbi:MAG: hypothetical protein FJ279_32875, partial [Planctomycetes bacterium]|nr:hypothetical protein [Planctomycetota bacterium]
MKEFFQSLNLDLPGLEAVREAKDAQAASEALATYMKARQKPKPIVAEKGTARDVTLADQVLEHVFTFVGCKPFKLPERIAWNEDPYDYDQWAIALNRHSHWVTLARAYAATADEKYAREFVSQLLSWIEAMPVPIGRGFAEGVSDLPGRTALTLDAGIRMGQTWFPAYYAFLHSPSFTTEAHVAMLKSFRDHALYLMEPAHFRTGGNWAAMEAYGLFRIGVMLPEFKDAALWRDTALARLRGEMDAQVYPDGAQVELTPGYHHVSLGNFLWAADVARENDVPIPADYMARLEPMFDYYARLWMPHGQAPALNDSGWHPAVRVLQDGLKHFPGRDDFRFLVSGGKEGAPPTYTSCFFPYAGWAVMRTGWTKADKYLLFDVGPFGAGHQHEDKLHIILHAFGKTILTEPGNYSYDRSAWRAYVLSTRGHNTVMVDGQEQHRRAVRGTWVTKERVSPTDDGLPTDEKRRIRLSVGGSLSVGERSPTRWLTRADFDFAEGTYADGYGPKNDRTVTHRRQVLFVKPFGVPWLATAVHRQGDALQNQTDYWIVVDVLEPSDQAEHRYDALFHLDAESVSIEPTEPPGAEKPVPKLGTGFWIATCDPGKGNLALVPLAPGMAAEIVKGQEKPVVQGWLPTGRHNELRPIPTVALTKRGAGRTVMAYALVPFGPDARCPVT